MTGIVGDTFQPVTRNVPAEEPPELPPNAELRVIGKPVNRVDAVPKVTGKARYTYDVQLPGMLYARIVSSTVPHARIKSIDTSAAEAYPGVKAVHILDRVLSIAQLRDASVEANERYPLVRYNGQPIAAVAAVSMRAAKAAAKLVRIEYERIAARHESRSSDARRRAGRIPRTDGASRDSRRRRCRSGLAAERQSARTRTRRPRRRSARRRAAGLRTGRSHRHARISHASADAHADGDARPRCGLARRGADALRLDAVHAQRARRSGGRVQAAEGKDPRDQRVHRRRLRREVRHRQLRRARDPPVAQGARARAARARSARGARQRRQPAEQPPARQAGREARRHA